MTPVWHPRLPGGRYQVAPLKSSTGAQDDSFSSYFLILVTLNVSGDFAISPWWLRFPLTVTVRAEQAGKERRAAG